MTFALGAICFSCARYKPFDAGHPSAYCAAFPDGIPDSIIYGGADHRQAIDGDHGIRFLLDPSKADKFAAWENLVKH